MTLRTAIAFLVLSSAVAAQTNKEYPSCALPDPAQAEQRADTNPKPQNIDGTLLVYTFLITGGGDLKPARTSEMLVIEKNTAGQEYMDQVLKMCGIVDYYRQQARGFPEQQDLVSIQGLADLERVSKVVRARDDAHLVELDEDGKARISLHPGVYVLSVRGSAGINEAFWLGTAKVESGKDTRLKLSKPLVSFAR